MDNQESLFDIIQAWFRSDGEDVLSVMDEEEEQVRSAWDDINRELDSDPYILAGLPEPTEEEDADDESVMDGCDPDLAYDQAREERLFGV